MFANPVQISDLAFRRHVLVQALILIDFLLSLTPKAKRKLEHTSNKSVLYTYALNEDNVCGPLNPSKSLPANHEFRRNGQRICEARSLLIYNKARKVSFTTEWWIPFCQETKIGCIGRQRVARRYSVIPFLREISRTRKKVPRKHVPTRGLERLRWDHWILSSSQTAATPTSWRS